MPETHASLEIIAPTVDEAVSRGAAELGIPAHKLLVEILDEGSAGVLGMGGRQARVRLTVLGAPSPAQPAPAAPDPEDEEDDELGPTDPDLETAGATVRELLSLMGIPARVSVRWGAADEPDEPRPMLVDIHGEDLSMLIGRRGESLAALQYLTRLIVGKEIGDYAPIHVDVEGYRARREKQLRQLARRMAEQAVERGRTMTLEPMPAAERRIVHLELRDHAEVYTESVGLGDQRKVTVVPRTTEDGPRL